MPTTDESAGDYREIELKGTGWILHLPVDESLMGDVIGRAWVEHHLQEACIQLRGRLYYENLETIEYPVDWWQALKARWFPSWARQRWPVLYRHYEINAYYPTVRDPGYPAVVRVPRMADRER